ncbi:hypothetical protein, partial [Nocardia carnea]|uniref:hypothetical protein n=1 Tax=Nocardia carnea TaxID=37328 RepID=UPI00245562E3
QLRRCQLLGRGFGLLLRHSIKCRHHGTFPLTIRSATQAGNTLKSTVPDKTVPERLVSDWTFKSDDEG